MSHHPNLKVIAFVGEDSEHAVTYLTDNHFPKVSAENMAEQVEHLVAAGQHRIVTSAIFDADSYKKLARDFPGELYLVSVGNTSEELVHMAHHHIPNDPKVINELLEKLDFRL